MNKNLAHTIFFLGDIVSIWILFIGYQEIRHTLTGIAIYKDIIEFGNRDGFFILGIFLPLVHMLPVMDFIWPEISKKYSHIVNRSFIIFTIVLIVSGFIVSSWMKSHVENSGYVYCRKASGVSALAKTLVYTKNMEICEEIVATDRPTAHSLNVNTDLCNPFGHLSVDVSLLGKSPFFKGGFRGIPAY